jgi:hypothetical protein
MTDYNKIYSALDRAVAAIQEEILFLYNVKADQSIIDSLQADITYITQGNEVIHKYQDLET